LTVLPSTVVDNDLDGYAAAMNPRRTADALVTS
jgi:hypothetical protein